MRPSQSGIYGGLRLLERVRGEMKKVDTESALLGEVGSPLFLKGCEFIYNWPFSFGVLRAFLTTPRDKWIRDVLLWLEIQRLTLPKGACFGMMRMLENHDVFKSVRFYGIGPMKALFALCSLAQGVPFVFNEQEAEFEDFMGRLLRLRRALPEIARGDLAAKSRDPEVMVFVCKLDGRRFSVVAINFASERREARISVDLDAIGAPPGRLVLYKAIKGRSLGGVKAGRGLDISLDLSPFGCEVVVVRPEKETLPPILSVKGRKALKVKKGFLSVERLRGSRIKVSNAYYEMVLRGGLVEHLTPRGSEVALVEGMELTEGKRKI